MMWKKNFNVCSVTQEKGYSEEFMSHIFYRDFFLIKSHNSNAVSILKQAGDKVITLTYIFSPFGFYRAIDVS